jgi:hypothetical protein
VKKAFSPLIPYQVRFMKSQPCNPDAFRGQPLRPAPCPLSYRELLADCVTIGIRRTEVTSFKYLLHLVLAKPEVETLPVEHAGWMPMGHRAVGAIALRLDYCSGQVLAQVGHRDARHKGSLYKGSV